MSYPETNFILRSIMVPNNYQKKEINYFLYSIFGNIIQSFRISSS